MYQEIIRPLLFKLYSDPEDAHHRVVSLLKKAGQIPGVLNLVRSQYQVAHTCLDQTVFGLRFPSVLGLAAGFDKHGEALPALAALGFSHLEIGTITAHAQPGNPRQRMFRLPADQGLINRMGFNNGGADALADTLRHTPKLSVPIGISLGKSKITPLETAAEDYVTSFKKLYSLGDYFAINVSSPNTPGLRALQNKSALEDIVGALQAENKRLSKGSLKPLLVKIAPDLELSAIDEVLGVCQAFNLSGIIATNTTISRDNLKTNINEAGGLSGAPVRERALGIVRHIHASAPTLPIIGVGGIFTADHAYQFIRAGASLVQAYTGFIYQGPGFAHQVHQGLAKLLARDGFSSIRQAIGVDSTP